MRKYFIIAVFQMAVSQLAVAQSDILWSELKKNQITPETLTLAFNEDWSGVSYTRTKISTTENSDYLFTEVVTYDASKPVGQQWAIVSVNDKAPENYFIRDFNKSNNTTKKKELVAVDINSLKKEGEEGATAIYSYTYSEAPSSYSFLKDCTAKIFLNKESGAIEKIEMINNGPTKMGSLKVQAVKIHTTFAKENQQWVVKESEMVLTGKFLGAQATNKEVKKYSIQK